MRTIRRFDERTREMITLRLDDVPRYHYHITSQDDWGKFVVLEPQEDGKNRAWDEPKIGRICVAPSIPHCFCAVQSNNKMYAYRTARPLRSVYPVNVSDYRMTGERWLLYPTKFVRVWSIPKHICYMMVDMGNGVELGGEEPNERRAQGRFKKKVFEYFSERKMPLETTR